MDCGAEAATAAINYLRANVVPLIHIPIDWFALGVDLARAVVLKHGVQYSELRGALLLLLLLEAGPKLRSLFRDRGVMML